MTEQIQIQGEQETKASIGTRISKHIDDYAYGYGVIPYVGILAVSLMVLFSDPASPRAKADAARATIQEEVDVLQERDIGVDGTPERLYLRANKQYLDDVLNE